MRQREPKRRREKKSDWSRLRRDVYCNIQRWQKKRTTERDRVHTKPKNQNIFISHQDVRTQKYIYIYIWYNMFQNEKKKKKNEEAFGKPGNMWIFCRLFRAPSFRFLSSNLYLEHIKVKRFESQNPVFKSNGSC